MRRNIFLTASCLPAALLVLTILRQAAFGAPKGESAERGPKKIEARTLEELKDALGLDIDRDDLRLLPRSLGPEITSGSSLATDPAELELHPLDDSFEVTAIGADRTTAATPTGTPLFWTESDTSPASAEPKHPLVERIEKAIKKGLWDGKSESPDASKIGRSEAGGPVDAGIMRLEEYASTPGARLWKDHAAAGKTLYFLAPGGQLIPLKGDFSQQARAGHLKLYTAETRTLGTISIATLGEAKEIKRGTAREAENPLHNYALQLDWLTGEAFEQGSKLNQALDRLELALRSTERDKDKSKAISQFKAELAETKAKRERWLEKRDALYLRVGRSEMPFIEAVMTASDVAARYRDFTAGGLMATRFANADDLLGAIYPDQSEELRALAPNLSRVGAKQFSESLLLDPAMMKEFLTITREAKRNTDEIETELDGFYRLVGEPGKKDIAKAYKQAGEALAKYVRVRQEWNRRKEALYARSAYDAPFMKSVIQPVDFKRKHRELSMPALLAERYRTADSFLAVMYPDQIEELRRLIPDLTEMDASDFDNSLFTQPELVTEFIESRRHLKAERVGALSHIRFTIMPKDVPSILDRMASREDGALKPFEPHLRTLIEKTLPEYERFNETLERLNRAIADNKKSAQVREVLDELNRAIQARRKDSTQWEKAKGAISAKAPNPWIRYYLETVVAAFAPVQSLDALLGKSYRSANDLLKTLYPEHIAQLRRVIPNLGEIGIQGFEKSLLISKDGVEQFLEMLERLPENARQNLFGNVRALSDIPLVAPFEGPRLPAKAHSGAYRLPYKVPGIGDVEDYEDPADPGYVKIIPDQTPEDEKQELRQRFGVFNQIIEANFRVLPLIDAFAAKPMPKSAARAIVAEVGTMVRHYQTLTESVDEKDEGQATQEKFAELSSEIEKQWADLGDSAILPEATAERIVGLETITDVSHIKNFHTLVNYVHKMSVRHLGGGGKATGQVRFGRHAVAFMNLEDRSPIQDGRLSSRPLAALLPSLKRWMHGSDYLILNGDEVWHHSTLGKHTAETYVKFADPDDGGMLRVRFSDWETIRGKRQRMSLLEALLKDLGIPYEIEADQYLTAMLDKNHGLHSAAQLAQAYPGIIQALHETSELNLYLEKAPKMVPILADVYIAEGGWPDLNWNNSGAVEAYYHAYAEKTQQRKRESLRRALNEELRRLGLSEIPEDVQFGQGIIDRYFTDVVQDALITGQLATDEHGLPHRREYHPVEDLADAVLADPARATHLASTASSLDAELQFEPIGMIGALRAERAILKFGRKAIVFYGLRDAETGYIGYGRAQRFESGELTDLSGEDLDRFLQRQGMALPSVDLLSDSQAQLLNEKLRAPIASIAVSGERVDGLPASPGLGGFVTAQITFDRRGKDDAVLAVPFTEPDDIDAIKRSVAVLTTGGGSLSHAAITTRELHIPSIIVPTAAWKKSPEGADELEVISFIPEGTQQIHSGLHLYPKLASRRIQIKEGDFVRIDGTDGTLSLFPEQDRDLAAAHSFTDRIIKGLSADKPLSATAVDLAIEEALYDPRFSSASRSEILDRLGHHAKAAVREETQAHERRLFDHLLGEISNGGADHLLDAPRLELLANLLEIKADDIPVLRSFHSSKTAAVAPAVPRRTTGSATSSREGKKTPWDTLAPSVLPLGAVGADDHLLVGGKFSKLGEILTVVNSQGAYIPSAMAVTTAGYLRFIEESGLKAKLAERALELDRSQAHARSAEQARKKAAEISREIQGLIRSATLKPRSGLGKEIWNGMLAHGLADDNVRLAVRSSAVQEDTKDAAFAGAAESYLYVKPKNALARIIENWASFFLPRGVFYRNNQGISSAEVLPSTMVQQMARADVAGVIFTRNPVSGADEIVINSAYGLGEGIVSGMVQTDRFVTRKSDGEEIRLPFVGDKRIAVMPNEEGSGTEVRGIEKTRRTRRSLSLEQTRRLSSIAKALEDHFGYPLDIEFAIEGDRIAILQARPVTVAGTTGLADL